MTAGSFISLYPVVCSIINRHLQAKISEGKAIIIFWIILLVLLCVLVALAGLLLVRRLVPLPVRESANTVTGIIYGATYVLYGITLAFSLYLGNQEANEARETVEREAGSLEGLFEIAQQLPQPQRDRIQELTESYARIVVEEEWPLMERGQESPQAEARIDELQETVVEYEPDTSAEQALYSQGITLAFDLEEERDTVAPQQPRLSYAVVARPGDRRSYHGITLVIRLSAPLLERFTNKAPRRRLPLVRGAS